MSYHPNKHYMRGPGPKCNIRDARQVLKQGARPVPSDQAPVGGAGFIQLADAPPPDMHRFNSWGRSPRLFIPSDTLKNFAASAFSYVAISAPFIAVFVVAGILSLAIQFPWPFE